LFFHVTELEFQALHFDAEFAAFHLDFADLRVDFAFLGGEFGIQALQIESRRQMFGLLDGDSGVHFVLRPARRAPLRPDHRHIDTSPGPSSDAPPAASSPDPLDAVSGDEELVPTPNVRIRYTVVCH
jgi:hypothetical protein